MARQNDTDGQRDPLAYLITEQDVHAYVDGELPPARRGVVERFLREHAMTARQAAAYLRSTFHLRAVRDQLYEDDALRREVERLLAKRAAARSGEPAAQVTA